MRNLKKGALLLFLAVGMVACSSAPDGEKVEAEEKQEVKDVKPKAEVLEVDTEASLINWVGTKPAGEHSGDMKVKSGSLQVMEGQIVGGSFMLDMTSINVTDLEGEKKSDLERHLKDGDFFEVEKYPEGKFEISQVTPVEGKESITHTITGNLTLKDLTKSVELPANVTLADGKLIAETPQFTIDRTEWGIVYKSSKLGEAAINDNMGIVIKLATK